MGTFSLSPPRAFISENGLPGFESLQNVLDRKKKKKANLAHAHIDKSSETGLGVGGIRPGMEASVCGPSHQGRCAQVAGASPLPLLPRLMDQSGGSLPQAAGHPAGVGRRCRVSPPRTPSRLLARRGKAVCWRPGASGGGGAARTLRGDSRHVPFLLRSSSISTAAWSSR